MENGKAHCGVRSVPRFDEETAKTIARQLPSFDGAGEYIAMQLMPVDPLIENLGSQKAVAEKLAVSQSLISAWKKQGNIPPKHLRAAYALLEQK